MRRPDSDHSRIIAVAGILDSLQGIFSMATTQSKRVGLMAKIHEGAMRQELERQSQLWSDCAKKCKELIATLPNER